MNMAEQELPQEFSAVCQWLAEHPLNSDEVDCATAVMLKILDGKCKMAEYDKVVMAQLYQAVKHLPGNHLGHDMHELITFASQQLSAADLCDDNLSSTDINGNDLPRNESLRLFIYEKRVLAESRISRPVMKAFKGRLRREHLLPVKINDNADS